MGFHSKEVFPAFHPFLFATPFEALLGFVKISWTLLARTSVILQCDTDTVFQLGLFKLHEQMQ